MSATIVTTTTVETIESNVGRAAVIYTNRYGHTPTLGSGGHTIIGQRGPINGEPGYLYESGNIGVVVKETPCAFRVRLLNGSDKGRVVTMDKRWIELG